MAGEEWLKAAAARAAKATAEAPQHWLPRDAGVAIAAAKTPAEAQSAWRQYLTKALTDFTVEGRNLAPNAPFIHYVPAAGGKPVKVPNTPDNITKIINEGGNILNKTEAEIRQMMPKLPAADVSQAATVTPFLGAAGATGVLPFTGLPGQGTGNVPPVPPELAPGAYGTEGASPASQAAVETAREVLQPQQTTQPAPTTPPAPDNVPYYGMDDSTPGGAFSPTPYQRTGPLADRAPTVRRAMDVAGGGSKSPQMGTTQTSPTAAAASDVLHSLIRGRFGEAGKGSPLEDRLTAAQEARDASGGGMAKGGAVGGKDQAIHKALEIIHHLISRR